MPKSTALLLQYLQHRLAAGGVFCYGSRMEGVNPNTDMDLDIETMIPHRGRMRLIEKVVAVDDQRALTAATTSEDWPLYRDGAVDVLVTIELVAQTAAVLEGWKRLQTGCGGTTGWLVGIKSADFCLPRLSVPALLFTEVIRSYALEGYAVFGGTVRMDERIVATLSIQAFRPEADA
jgi:predicted hotdog family 3-hydroxylacyl-ACP dehydratase